MADTTVKKEKGHIRRHWFFYTALLVTTGLVGYLWISKSMALRNQAANFENEKQEMMLEAQEAFDQSAEKNLELTMKTFVWAVRSEMTRGNQEQVDQYFKQLVKSDKITEVTLTDPKSMIILSSNKKNEGSQLAADYANAVENIEEMTVINRGVTKIAAAPVLSMDSRIGTLLVVYKSDIFQPMKKTDLTKND